MRVTPLELPEVLMIEPRVFADARGWFKEGWHEDRYTEAGIPGPFVQDNISYSTRGVLRGLHYQWPRSQGKLVTVLQGTVWDVAVDVRRGSPTFGRWVGAELSADAHGQLWLPPGFAHGFVVLSAAAVFQYKVTAPHAPEEEVTLRWNDPAFAIEWPVADPILSTRDAEAPLLGDVSPERLPQWQSAR